MSIRTPEKRAAATQAMREHRARAKARAEKVAFDAAWKARAAARRVRTP